jgi:hypothetical protein
VGIGIISKSGSEAGLVDFRLELRPASGQSLILMVAQPRAPPQTTTDPVGTRPSILRYWKRNDVLSSHLSGVLARHPTWDRSGEIQAMTTPWRFEILTRNILRLQCLKRTLLLFSSGTFTSLSACAKHGLGVSVVTWVSRVELDLFTCWRWPVNSVSINARSARPW